MIVVTECGKLNSIQDLGRFGLRSIGIGTSGAMDTLALKVGNVLTGNADSAASIELQTFPFSIRFERELRFAVTGSDTCATLDGLPLPPWWSTVAKAGQVLRVQHPRAGARAYVSVSGGIEVPVTLGSRSTNMRNTFGGYHGRALEKGDRLEVSVGTPSFTQDVGANPPAELLPEGALLNVRVIPGAEFQLLAPAQQQAFWDSDWAVTPQSDRGGYRLRGPELRLPRPMEMRSYGVVAGIIQLPPSGQPIVQLSDANTAGGYPRLGGVIEADLHRLGQARAGTLVRFAECNFIEAQKAQEQVDHFLSSLRSALQSFGNSKLKGLE